MLLQTWGTVSKANLKTSPSLLDQIPCRSEEAYSINEIRKPIFFIFKKIKNKHTIGRQRKTKDYLVSPKHNEMLS